MVAGVTRDVDIGGLSTIEPFRVFGVRSQIQLPQLSRHG